jgi:hypothetical protein
MKNFTKEHLVQVYFNYLAPHHQVSLPPLDRFMRSYFNQYKSIGSSERSMISEKIFNLIRYSLKSSFFRYEHLLSYMTKSKPFKMLDAYERLKLR